MPDEREKFTLDEMLSEFDIHRVSLGGPVFDIEKLSWLNGIWIREELSDEPSGSTSGILIVIDYWHFCPLPSNVWRHSRI